MTEEEKKLNEKLMQSDSDLQDAMSRDDIILKK